jgi:hypothetical protein
MPNGKPGDHPFTDIVNYKRDVYSPRAAALVREIARLADEKTRSQLADMLFHDYNEYANPDVAKLERALTDMRDQLLRQTRERGYEV